MREWEDQKEKIIIREIHFSFLIFQRSNTNFRNLIWSRLSIQQRVLSLTNPHVPPKVLRHSCRDSRKSFLRKEKRRTMLPPQYLGFLKHQYMTRCVCVQFLFHQELTTQSTWKLGQVVLVILKRRLEYQKSMTEKTLLKLP